MAKRYFLRTWNSIVCRVFRRTEFYIDGDYRWNDLDGGDGEDDEQLALKYCCST